MLLTITLRIALRLVLGGLLLCGLVVMFGGRPDPADALWARAGFAACDLPCYANITPEKTAFLQASSLLQRHVTTLDRLYNSGNVVSFWAEDQRLAGSISSENGVVSEVRLTLPLSLRQFIAALQAPDCVIAGTPDNPLPRLVLVWVRKGITIAAVAGSGRTLNPDQTQILALSIHHSTPDECTQGNSTAWRGFAPQSWYRP